MQINNLNGAIDIHPYEITGYDDYETMYLSLYGEHIAIIYTKEQPMQVAVIKKTIYATANENAVAINKLLDHLNITHVRAAYENKMTILKEQ